MVLNKKQLLIFLIPQEFFCGLDNSPEWMETISGKLQTGQERGLKKTIYIKIKVLDLLMNL